MKVSLILLAGLGVAAALGRRPAALRHWVLAVAVLCAAALPLAERALPGWPMTMPKGAPRTELTAVSVDVSVGGASGDGVASPLRAARVDWIAAIWLCGAGFSLLILASGMARLIWLSRRARPAASNWTAAAKEIFNEHGMRRGVDLLQSDHPSLLATWGVARPRIILPAAAATWSDDLIRVVLRHELAHIRRFDWAVQIAGELLRSAYWFNPLTWVACTRLRTESEHACDDEVLRSGVDAAAYAAHLVTLARQLGRQRVWLPAPAMARHSTLHRRVTVMLNRHIDRSRVGLGARFGILGLLLTGTLAVAGAQASGTLTATIVDPQGAVLPGVRVTITNAGQTQQTQTNSSGRFQFTGLPLGDYVLRVELPGFKAYDKTVTIANANVVQTIALELGQVRETISVVDAGETEPRVTTASGPVSSPPCDPEPATTTAAVRVGGNIRPPIKLKDVAPSYPASLRGSGASGEVVLDGVIGVDGLVHDIRPRESKLLAPKLPSDATAQAEQAFAESMTAAVTQWQFRSTMLNCVPVEVPITITGRFRAQAP
jgi:beta-lactamase regulating signal transducer with metallopeptidase domain